MNINEYRAKLGERQRAYCQLFTEDQATTVLEDLAKFCRADVTTFHPDPRMHAVLEGRREVWLRIQDHLNKTPEEFLEYYMNIKPTQGEKKDD